MHRRSTFRFRAPIRLRLAAAVSLAAAQACSQGGQGYDDGSDEIGSVAAERGDAGRPGANDETPSPTQSPTEPGPGSQGPDAEGSAGMAGSEPEEPEPTETGLPADDTAPDPESNVSNDDAPAQDDDAPAQDDDAPAQDDDAPAQDDDAPDSDGGIPNGETPQLDFALPCDVLEEADLACVSAHSTVRTLVSDYAGPLYRVERADGLTLDVGGVDGFADAATQDAFCEEQGCVIELVYDQSGMGNDLTEAPPGSAKTTPGDPVEADALPVTIAGRSVYGMSFRPGQGYRKLVGAGTAQGDEAETIYMVSSQHDLINGCCFEYGNASTTANNDGNGTAEAVYFGMGVIWGTGSGEGPWVMADLENGLYAGWENGQDRDISTNIPLPYDFVTAVLVGDTAETNDGRGRFALYGGDATSGTLTTMYDGIRPEKPGYVPMQKQGSVVLSVASDNSDGDGGRFYEGVMANGAAPKETLDALQAAIVDAGYGN